MIALVQLEKNLAYLWYRYSIVQVEKYSIKIQYYRIDRILRKKRTDTSH